VLLLLTKVCIRTRTRRRGRIELIRPAPSTQHPAGWKRRPRRHASSVVRYVVVVVGPTVRAASSSSQQVAGGRARARWWFWFLPPAAPARIDQSLAHVDALPPRPRCTAIHALKLRYYTGPAMIGLSLPMQLQRRARTLQCKSVVVRRGQARPLPPTRQQTTNGQDGTQQRLVDP
jgi:hypothetical protein